MYIRVKTTPNSPKKSVQIVESKRIGNTVRQYIVRHVGTALDEDELKRLKELAEYIKSKLESEASPTLFAPEELAQMSIEAKKKKQASEEELHVNIKQLREEQRIITGIHEIYSEIYNSIGFGKSLGHPQRIVEANRKLFHMVMARIAHPCSKKESASLLAKDFGVHLSLQGIYKMMDKLTDERIAFIQKLSYSSALDLFSEKIDVIFYDCTTLYFESFKEDDLKENGYSKDMKFNQPQVMLALMVTKEGIPVGYDVYPGSCFEGHTLENAINKLEEKYRINNLIFVADSAMLSEENLRLLEKLGKNYIVGARIKNVNDSIKAQILDKSNYQKLSLNSHSEAEGESVVSIDYHNGRKLYVTYNISRAEKDRYDREKAITKLKQKLLKSKNPKELLSNYGYKKFIKIVGNSTLQLDENQIEEAARWDGLHGIITNSKTMTIQQVVEHYHGLWQIEESFRISKHDLRIRPIFHWTPKRIKAHIAICYMALVCIRHLEHRVKLQYQKLSPEVIRNELLHVQLSILKDIKTGKRYAIPSKPTIHQKKIYQTLGLKLCDIPYIIK